jgi:aminoglycoside phosphotransferase (APT) family kinase protein
MNGAVVGNPLNAVLVPRQAERFASLVGVELDRLQVNVTGWNKLVLLAPDRVFLFPRAQTGVEWFQREITAYRALSQSQLTVVPRLLGCWDDPDVYPFPFAAVTRLRGRIPSKPETLLDQLGRSIAGWHELGPPELPGARPPRHLDLPHHRWLQRALDPATVDDAAAEAATRLQRPDRLTAWTVLLRTAARLDPVLVHGDIHEDQLLAEAGRLTGIIDWETARIDHPFWDFDLGEWGTGLWRRHRRDFSALWSRLWRAYAVERGLDSDPRPLETAFRLRVCLYILNDGPDPAIVGTIDEQLGHL